VFRVFGEVVRLHDARMQQILPVPINVVEYVKTNYQDQIASPSHCSHCNDTQGLWRHGTYGRWISWCLETVRILVARFLCRKCGRTVSCLPDWALSYRRVNVHTTQRYFDGERGEREMFQWESLLRSYQKRIDSFAPTLIRSVNTGLGAPPSKPGQPLWPWIKKACGTLQSAARQLISTFRITLFGRYRCHQPCGFDKPHSAGMTGG